MPRDRPSHLVCFFHVDTVPSVSLLEFRGLPSPSSGVWDENWIINRRVADIQLLAL